VKNESKSIVAFSADDRRHDGIYWNELVAVGVVFRFARSNIDYRLIIVLSSSRGSFDRGTGKTIICKLSTRTTMPRATR
jgi:hypothetical protein